MPKAELAVLHEQDAFYVEDLVDELEEYARKYKEEKDFLAFKRTRRHSIINVQFISLQALVNTSRKAHTQTWVQTMTPAPTGWHAIEHA